MLILRIDRLILDFINLYFGNPCDDWAKESAEEIAINYDVTMDRAVFMMVNKLLESSSSKEDGHSFLDDRFGWAYERLVYAPNIVVEQKVEKGVTYSVMVISEDFVIHKATGSHLPLTDRALTLFGEDFEEMFGIEYLGHKWSDQKKLLQ
jgi:hypothetical protein